jgi:hypothetical protein
VFIVMLEEQVVSTSELLGTFTESKPRLKLPVTPTTSINNQPTK